MRHQAGELHVARTLPWILGILKTIPVPIWQLKCSSDGGLHMDGMVATLLAVGLANDHGR